MWQTRPLRRQSRNRHVSASGRHTPGPPLPRARPRATPSSSEAPQPCRRGAPRPLSRLDGGAPAAVVERGGGESGCREIPLTRGKRSDAGAAPANITVKDVPPQVRFCKRQVGAAHSSARCKGLCTRGFRRHPRWLPCAAGHASRLQPRGVNVHFRTGAALGARELWTSPPRRGSLKNLCY